MVRALLLPPCVGRLLGACFQLMRRKNAVKVSRGQRHDGTSAGDAKSVVVSRVISSIALQRCDFRARSKSTTTTLWRGLPYPRKRRLQRLPDRRASIAVRITQVVARIPTWAPCCGSLQGARAAERRHRHTEHPLPAPPRSLLASPRYHLACPPLTTRDPRSLLPEVCRAKRLSLCTGYLRAPSSPRDSLGKDSMKANPSAGHCIAEFLVQCEQRGGIAPGVGVQRPVSPRPTSPSPDCSSSSFLPSLRTR